MDRVLLDQVIDTDYGQFDLTWGEGLGFDGDFDRVFDGQVNGLVGAARPDGVYLNLARRSGGSSMCIVLRDAAPEIDGSYEDVVEVSASIPFGADVRWSTWAGMSSGILADLAAGTYRVRVSARGRDAGREGEFVPGLVDAYLVELWPAPGAVDSILRIGSKDAEYWHQQVGRRR